jgi:uncharacterized small protein (DUF1192 family)
VSDDLTRLTDEELEGRVAAIRAEMRPLENELARLRADRDVVITEQRRRQRTAHREKRASLKAAMREGKFPTIAELVAGGDDVPLEEFVYNLKTGGEVRLGFPGARKQTLTFTDGVQTAQAGDLAEASRLYTAGWDHGTPGRPGVRVHFPGTRQERLVPADDVIARHRSAIR